MRSHLILTARFAALAAAAAIVLALGTPAPAQAHVPFLEPPGILSSERGPDTDPFPSAIHIGGPEVSRAVYGYLAPDEFADVYTFTVRKAVTAPIGILVPQGNGAERFRPELTVYGPDKPVGIFDREGKARRTFYEPFAQMTLFKGPEKEVSFLPGRPYYVIVTGGKGSVTSGRYVISMGTVESFGLEDIVRTPGDIAAIKAGAYGGAPADWRWAIPWAIGGALAAAGLVAVVVWLVRRRRGSGSRSAAA